MNCADALTQNLETFLEQHVAPQAESIDSNPDALKNVFDQLNDKVLRKIWFASPPPHAHLAMFSDLLLERIAEFSGALAFTVAQYMGACRRLAIAPNKDLVAEIAPRIANGEVTLAVGTTHMKAGRCVVNAKSDGADFIFNGTVPWVSGFGLFSHSLIAARMGTHGIVVALVALSEAAGIAVSQPFPLSVMNSTCTVSLSLKDLRLSQKNILFALPDEAGKQVPIPPPYYTFPLGCARAALNLATEGAKKYRDKDIEVFLDALAKELEETREEAQMVYSLNDAVEVMGASIKARAKMDRTIMRVINAALPLVGGSANVTNNPMGRLYREAAVYSTSLLVAAGVRAKIAAVLD